MQKLLLLLCCVAPTLAHAQRKSDNTRMFHMSVAPGLGTNGMNPGSYTNVFSLHLTSGYAATSLLMEIALISNLNTTRTRGFQLAGLANITGANAFAGMQPKEKEQKIKAGFEANLTGVQVSGLTNIVLNQVFGGQITGGVNVTKGALLGLQLAGGANVTHSFAFGVQVAGVSNTAYESMDGVQLAALMNYTHGALAGIQISAWNQAGVMEGVNTYARTIPTGVQIGLVNKARQMDGFQIGLINWAGRSQGTQIGLINIYRRGKTTGTRDGTAIGLFNVGDFGYLAVYSNELFLTVVELATGNPKNSRFQTDSRHVEVLNGLIYANDIGWLDGKRQRWAIGYGLKKIYFNKSAAPGMNRYRFISFGIDWMHMNKESGEITKGLSLIGRPQVSVGSRLHPKLHSIYVFASIAFNGYVTDTDQRIQPSVLESSAHAGNHFMEFWPGFAAGVMLK